MFIDMSNYRVVYDDMVWNVVGLYTPPMYSEDSFDENGEYKSPFLKICKLEVIVLNANGTLITIIDDANKFQFIPKVA